MSDIRLFFSSCQGAQVAQNRQSSLIHTFIQFLQISLAKNSYNLLRMTLCMALPNSAMVKQYTVSRKDHTLCQRGNFEHF